MKSALIFPPQGHFTQPNLSLPSLAAYLRDNGKPDVTLFDSNIEAYDYFLSKDRLQRSLERVRASDKLETLNCQSQLNYTEMESYQQFSEIDLTGEKVVESIEEAKQVIRDPRRFYDYKRYLWAGRTIEQALRLFSAEYSPSRLTAHGFVMRYRVESSTDIIAAIDDESENPYVEYFREQFLPRLIQLDPDLIGISVTFPSQAIPTLTLARQIKQWKPDVHITLGGGLLAYVAEKLSKRPEVWSLIDSMVLLEGERALLQLCEAIDGEREISKVTNLIYRDSNGDVCTTKSQEPLNIETLPTPDFDGLPLDLYFSPELVLPLAATRGCYWGKCVFCTLYTVIGPGYRGRTIEQTVDDMAKLKTKYGASSFYLAIEDLPPNMAKKLPRAILDANLDISWWCDARLEHEVFDQTVCDELAASGCKRIAFGYESSSKRVLERMCKGIDPEESLNLISRVRKAGMSVSLYAMVGFPTETKDEAQETLQTILDHRDLIQEVSVRVFYLDETSEVFKQRESFDITEIFPDPDADLQVYYDFKTSSGMTRSEAREAYLEFTRALRSHFPVFQNTNLLYHELKSHYFLYLTKFGSWEQLRDLVLNPPSEPIANTSTYPYINTKLHRNELHFDRSKIDERLATQFSSALRPRYQSDLLDQEDRVRLDREMTPTRPSPCTLVYDSSSAQVHCLTPKATQLLDRCDGTESLEEIIESFTGDDRLDAEQFLGELQRTGIIATRHQSNRESAFRIIPVDPKNSFDFEDVADK